MSALSTILSLLGKLVPVLGATERLVRAAKDSKPPPPELPPAPPPLASGAPDALSYLRGANDEKHRQAERERLRWSAKELAAKAAEGDEGEAEKPTGGEGGT